MPGAGRAEVIFIAAMMILILVVCVVAVYAFFKTYKKEMREKQQRLELGRTVWHIDRHHHAGRPHR